MPKRKSQDDSLAGELQTNPFFAGVRRVANMDNYKGLAGGGKRAAPAPKPVAMNRKQVAGSAAGLGYDMTKDGRFVPKKQTPSKSGLGGHRGK